MTLCMLCAVMPCYDMVVIMGYPILSVTIMVCFSERGMLACCALGGYDLVVWS